MSTNVLPGILSFLLIIILALIHIKELKHVFKQISLLIKIYLVTRSKDDFEYRDEDCNIKKGNNSNKKPL